MYVRSNFKHTRNHADNFKGEHSRSSRRWTCWTLLGLYMDFHRLHLRHCIAGRDGFHVSIIWNILAETNQHQLLICFLRAPISGGQYHWVSEFAPPKYQKFLSYVTGWMSMLSWQAGNASGSFLTGTIVQALLIVNYPDYDEKPYHGTLLVFAMAFILYVVNIWGAAVWPKLQNGLMVLHILGFFVVIIVLWVCAPHQPAKVVFTEFRNGGGWSSMGLSLMVGQITGIFSLIGKV